MSEAKKQTLQVPDFFAVRVGSVAPGVPLPFDLYLVLMGKAVKFRSRGDVLTAERLKLLSYQGGEHFLVPEDQRPVYLESIKSVIKDPSSSKELKSRFLKESAFLHVHDLFTKKEIQPIVLGAQSLIEEMVSFVSSDVEAVASLMRLSVHDYYTYNHSVDVAVYSIVLAKKIIGDDKKILMAAGLGGFLHDIGKREIDWNVINKEGPLTPEEWQEIKQHPVYGRNCLEDITSVPDESKLIVYEHHENFDGTGYPCGLKEEDISKLARIVSIADVFDALTTDRSYHKGISPSEALNMMYGMQPGKFDPSVFKTFDKNFNGKKGMPLGKDFDPCSPQPITRLMKK